ncbi:unnamed protein product [Urochloa humidicola]
MVTPSYGEISDYRYRLINYMGDGILLGTSFGSAFHFIRGLRNSPRGARLAGSVHAIRTNVPRFAGEWGAVMASLCAVESAVCIARGRTEDHWNSIAPPAPRSLAWPMRAEVCPCRCAIRAPRCRVVRGTCGHVVDH